MKTPTPFQLVGVCLAAGIIMAVADMMRESKPQLPQTSGPVAKAHSVSPEEHAANRVACDREARAQIQNLERLQIANAKYLRASEKTTDARRFVQFTYRGSWSALLATNRAAFERLSRSATTSPSGGVPCTICNKTLSLGACIVCTTVKGKCVTCCGTGQAAANEVCPTCLGNGNCFVCLGTGSMPCPYCNDGIVSAHQAAPPPQLPVE